MSHVLPPTLGTSQDFDKLSLDSADLSLDPQQLRYRQKVLFIVQLAKALHHYGTPAHRLELAFAQVAERLGLKAQLFAMPTGLIAAIDEQDGGQRTTLLRTDAGDVHLEKLSDLDEIVESVLRGGMTLTEGIAAIKSVQAKPMRYPRWLQVLCFAACGSVAARFLGGAEAEIAASFLTGGLIGLLSLLGARYKTVGKLFPMLTALSASICSVLLSSVQQPLAVMVVIIAALIVLVPGMGLTVALTELATNHLVSGTARLMAAISSFLQMGFGVALGTYLSVLLVGETNWNLSGTLPGWTAWVALLGAPPTFLVLFQARPRDLGWTYCAGILAFGSARLGAELLGPELGAFLAAFAVAAGANLFARYSSRPSAVFSVPGIILLVPGSMGIKSMASLLQHDVVQGLEIAFQTALIGGALVAGLLLAPMVVAPRKAL